MTRKRRKTKPKTRKTSANRDPAGGDDLRAELRSALFKIIGDSAKSGWWDSTSIRALDIARKHLADEAKAQRKADAAAGFNAPGYLPDGYMPGEASGLAGQEGPAA